MLKHTAATAALVLYLWMGTASASVVYSQPNDRPDQPSFYSDGAPGQWFNQRMADDFILSAPCDITGVRWWGGSQNFQFPDLTNMGGFRILILPEANGVPDLNNPLADAEFVMADSNPVPTGEMIFGGGIQYEHNYTFAAPVPVNAGQRYWVSIGAFLYTWWADAWVWSGSTVGDLINATDHFDANGFTVFNPTFNDLAFEIDAVPEPASALLLLAGAAFVTARRR